MLKVDRKSARHIKNLRALGPGESAAWLRIYENTPKMLPRLPPKS